MKLRVRTYDVDASEPSVMIHDDDCIVLGVKENDRVKISGKSVWVSLVDRSDTVLERGEILIPNFYMGRYDINEGDEVEVTHSPKPDSVMYIRKNEKKLTL